MGFEAVGMYASCIRYRLAFIGGRTDWLREMALKLHCKRLSVIKSFQRQCGCNKFCNNGSL